MKTAVEASLKKDKIMYRNNATTGDKKEEDMPAKSWFNYLTDE